MTRTHSSGDLRQIISRAVGESLGDVKSAYFVSDSATNNKEVVRQFMMENEGNEHWFPCSVHFMQMAIKEAVQMFFDGHHCVQSVAPEGDEIEVDDLESEKVIQHSECLSESSLFDRITGVILSIGTILRQSHKYLNLFETCQRKCRVQYGGKSDVKSRFDLTYDMFDSILNNKSLLPMMQNMQLRNRGSWPISVHLAAEDFEKFKTSYLSLHLCGEQRKHYLSHRLALVMLFQHFQAQSIQSGKLMFH